MSLWKRLTAFAVTAALALGALAGCSFEDSAGSTVALNDWPVTVNGVTIHEEPAGVAVASANLADVVLSLGYEVQLKSKTADCTQEELASLPDIPAENVEQIQSAGATLLLTDQALDDTVQASYDTAGISVVVIPAATDRTSLTTLYESVGMAMKGAVTGKDKADKAADSLFITIDDVTRMIPQSDTVKTGVYLYDLDGSVATGDTLAGTLLEAAGMTNIVADSTGGTLDLAALQRGDPDYIFCPTGLKAQLSATAGYQDLTAVQNGQVYEMDPNLMTLQGEGMISAVLYMAGVVYPELNQTTSPAPGGTSSDPSASQTGDVIPNSSIPAGMTLQYDDENDYVLELQNRLDDLGYMFMAPTGLYGDGTQQAVMNFQLANGFETTGVADPETLTAIFSDDAVRADGTTGGDGAAESSEAPEMDGVDNEDADAA